MLSSVLAVGGHGRPACCSPGPRDLGGTVPTGSAQAFPCVSRPRDACPQSTRCVCDSRLTRSVTKVLTAESAALAPPCGRPVVLVCVPSPAGTRHGVLGVPSGRVAVVRGPGSLWSLAVSLCVCVRHSVVSDC